MGLPVLHEEVVIANGTSDSNAVDVSERVAVGILMPSSWTAASLTFRASVDGVNFFPVYDAAGVELVVTAAAGTYIVVAPDATRALRYLKIRSGTNGAAVNQGAARTLKLAVVQDTGS